MNHRPSVLFLLENDYYPRDMRVFNECTSLSQSYSCYVLAPRRNGEKLFESIEGVTCFRFPHFEARSLRWILLEYAIAAFWFSVLVPLITFAKRVKVIHVANPPDFLIPLTAWLKLFGVKLTFDVHDLSIETFKGKKASRSTLGRLLLPALAKFEAWSIAAADLIVTTNSSIREYVARRDAKKPISVVRNSNPILFRTLSEVGKEKRARAMNIGYFGLLQNDEAAGLDNFFALADALGQRGVPFKFSIVGDGAGLEYLRGEVQRRSLQPQFEFFGYVDLPEAFGLIKNFDFGLLTWGYLPKNHLHTAMKVMDYMCCAVPVCSLRLKEQLASTNGIGIHEDSFEGIAEKMMEIFLDDERYDRLRQKTLKHFNEVLCWERQRDHLLDAYSSLLAKPQVAQR